jgi:pimeloyl-ACP methyl ester carboxylesterase
MPSQPRDQPPLVLLHGLSGCAAQWAPVLTALREHHTVLCPALAGHVGGPALPEVRRGSLWAITALADQVERDMDRAGIGAAHLCGNSLGGWLALELARRGRAHAVVALAPAGGWHPGSREQHRLHRKMRLNHRALKVVGPLAGVLTRRPRLRRLILRDVMARGDRLSAHDATQILRAAWKCPGYLELLDELVAEAPPHRCEDVSVPITVVWGTADRLLPPDRYAVWYRRSLPQAQFIELEGLGHVLMADDPATVARTILATTTRSAAAV